MLPDFELIQHHIPHNNDITIYPVADVHLGAAMVMETEFAEFCEKIAKEKNTYVILGGDLLDNGIKSAVGASIYRQKYFPSEAKSIMTEYLAPLAEKGKILACINGNHEFRSTKETDDTLLYDICFRLHIEHLFRESIAFIKIQFGNTDYSGKQNPTYVLTVVHGHGGGMTGAFVNKGEKFGNIDGSDALILGHSHKPFVSQPGKIKIDTHNNQVKIVPYKVICASSWLQYGGYAAQMMLQPTTHTSTKLILCGNHKEMIVTM